MEKLKILLYSDTIDFGLHTQTFQKSLNFIFSNLRKNFIIEDHWIIFKNIILCNSQHHDTQIHKISDFKNSKHIIDMIKPDLVLLNSAELNSYSILLAAKYTNIPIIFLDAGYPAFFFKSSQFNVFRYRLSQFFSIGDEFLKKLFFLFKSQDALQQNFFNKLNNFFKIIKNYLSFNPRLEFRKFSDLYICSNDDWSLDAINHGVEKNKIFVAGEFTLDEVFQKIQILQTKPPKISKKRNVLFVTTSTVEHGIWKPIMRDKIIKSVAESLFDLSNIINSKIKIHPGENIEDYKKIVHNIDPNIEILKEGDLTQLFFESDIIITFGHSTSMTEAMILKKPILHLNFYDESISLIEEGLSIECKNIFELQENLKTLNFSKFHLKKYDEIIQKKIYKFDGKCGERATKAIFFLIK